MVGLSAIYLQKNIFHLEMEENQKVYLAFVSIVKAYCCTVVPNETLVLL